jgi:hypothetical protein
MEKTLETGFAREELEAQGMGLLPDRVEMRRRRRGRHGRRGRRGRDISATASVFNENNNYLINLNEVEFDD